MLDKIFQGAAPPPNMSTKKLPEGSYKLACSNGSSKTRSEFSSDSIRIVLTEILFTLLVAGFAQYACLD